MVSLRDGKTTSSQDEETNTPSNISAKKGTSSTIKEERSTTDHPKSAKSNSKKRDASDITKSEEPVDKAEHPELPTTPSRPTKAAKIAKEEKDVDVEEQNKSPTTPGRYGPIKPHDFSVKPDIKPFKGEPGHKVRKTAYEKDEEYKQFARDNEGHTFHELYVCFDKGPKGSPTYDKQGFILDYHKVADWMKPQAYNKQAMMKGMDRAVEKSKQDEKAMAELFFEPGQKPTGEKIFWQDRVSKDLKIPWHKIEVKHFEEWVKKGFTKAKSADYENISEADRKRWYGLLDGASLRK